MSDSNIYSHRKPGPLFAALANRKEGVSSSFHNLMEKYWTWFMLVIGLVIIGLEIAEHFPEAQHNDFLYLLEVLLTVVLLSVIAGLIRWLLVVIRQRTEAISVLQQKQAIRSQLSMTQDLHEMAEQVTRHAYAALLPDGVRLFLYDPIQDEYNLEAWIGSALPEPAETGARKQKPRLGVELCRACVARHPDLLIPFNGCPLADKLRAADPAQGICIPLVRGVSPVGLLHFYTAPTQALSPDRIKHFKYVTPEISASLKIAIEMKAREEIALSQTVNAVQLDLARDLHDTLGQNVSYLRMRLGALLEAGDQLDLDMKKQIGQMYDVTRESYDLVRGMLSVLKSGASTGLVDLLDAHARMVADRSGLKIVLTNEGNSEPLPPRSMRQVFYIFREALSNVEKHAHASQVKVEIRWEEEHFALSVRDDGQGFDPSNAPSGGHYGLKFMAERAKSLHGEFLLHSAPQEGTFISIQLPYT